MLTKKQLQLFQLLVKQSLFIFTYVQALQQATTLNVSKRQLTKIIHELIDDGWIIRIKKGMYAGTGNLPGFFDIPPLVIGNKILEPSYVSHLSALHYYGFIDQLPVLTFLVTTKKIVTPSMRSNKGKPHYIYSCGHKFHYRFTNEKRFFGYVTVWMDDKFSVSVSDLERTILDGFIDQELIGGFGEIMAILGKAIKKLSIQKLVSYAILYNQGATIKRLGWALSYYGAKAADIKPLRNFKVKTYYKLDKNKKAIGKYNKEWQIRENTKL